MLYHSETKHILIAERMKKKARVKKVWLKDAVGILQECIQTLQKDIYCPQTAAKMRQGLIPISSVCATMHPPIPIQPAPHTYALMYYRIFHVYKYFSVTQMLKYSPQSRIQ